MTRCKDRVLNDFVDRNAGPWVATCPLPATHTTAIILIAGCAGIYWATTCFHAQVSVAQRQNDAPAWLR